MLRCKSFFLVPLLVSFSPLALPTYLGLVGVSEGSSLDRFFLEYQLTFFVLVFFLRRFQVRIQSHNDLFPAQL